MGKQTWNGKVVQSAQEVESASLYRIFTSPYGHFCKSLENMNDRSLQYAHYWRNSLADTELGRGSFREYQNTGFEQISEEHLSCGRINGAVLEKYFQDEAEPTDTVEVILFPQVYHARFEHGKVRPQGIPAIVTPLITPALLARDGRIFPSSKTVVPRDLLEPLAGGTFALGLMADLDSFLSKEEVPAVEYPPERSATELRIIESEWDNYIQGCERLLAQICPGWPTNDFTKAKYGYLVKKKPAQGASRYILPLYDHLCAHKPAVPLFATYTCEDLAPAEPCLPATSTFSARLGHASDRYPLAPAQRDALTHLLTARHGEILAVNGPPGTDKTTLLLSVVTSLWAKAALEGGPPPVILAASTNNQAVANIIDAFGKDFSAGEGTLAGRWLPRVRSFGAYFPGRSRIPERDDKYQTRSFFEQIEQEEAVDDAERHYLACAQAAFPRTEPSVQAFVAALLEEIRAEAGKLVTIETTWMRWAEARENVRNELGDDPAAELANRRKLLASLEIERCTCTALAAQWAAYRAQESFFFTWFAWLPAVAARRLRLAVQALRRICPEDFATEQWQNLEQIDAAIKARVHHADINIQEQQRRFEQGQRALELEQIGESAWKRTSAIVGTEDKDTQLTLEEIDILADTQLRFRIFLLTTHYWEGRWLLEMQALRPDLAKEKRKNGYQAMKHRWHRRMMLTPCVVSTFFMLPLEMNIKRYDKEQQSFVDDYLYDFADLLIVDEAGQVLPEVAGASFALAQRALVIGDTLQIEPIWSIPTTIDMGNMREVSLLQQGNLEAESYYRLADLGKTAASGSVMQIAQTVCRYSYEPTLARGLFLFEHRRCFDEIIGYCNDLCYRGKLVPKRGPKLTPDQTDTLPPMGYVHVNGICQQSRGGSRHNLLEAEVIAAWLAQHRESLERQYRKPIHAIVGVVTPFSAQVHAIAQACADRGIAVGTQAGKMTVGTVHSLQGAERDLIIFSMVYSKHADGGFIDRSSSMLNVTVSRAKDAFLFIGDMDVLQVAPFGSPRRQLARWLCSDEAHALSFEYDQPRRDLVSGRNRFTQLRDATQHDAVLMEVLTNAAHEVHIVSPWLRLDCIEETGALAAMTVAVERGVRVQVYTDAQSNISHHHKAERMARQRALQTALETMRHRGILAMTVEKVHSKVLIGDENVYCIGSYNWFSASRTHGRHETSLLYQGPDMATEIEIMKNSLQRRLTNNYSKTEPLGTSVFRTPDHDNFDGYVRGALTLKN